MISDQLTILVTGSSGFIGSHVVLHLTAAGHKIIGYDLIPPEFKFPDGSIYLCGDIRTARLPHEGIDAVVHLAALAGVRPSMDRPFDYLSTNVTATLRLLDRCRSHGIPRFVFERLWPGFAHSLRRGRAYRPMQPLRAHQAPRRAMVPPLRPSARHPGVRPAVLLRLGTRATS